MCYPHGDIMMTNEIGVIFRADTLSISPFDYRCCRHTKTNVIIGTDKYLSDCKSFIRAIYYIIWGSRQQK